MKVHWGKGNLDYPTVVPVRVSMTPEERDQLAKDIGSVLGRSGDMDAINRLLKLKVMLEEHANN
jgi:hypothetical protein